MQSYENLAPDSIIAGTLDADELYVQLDVPAPYRMRRILVYDTYEVWEVSSDAQSTASPANRRVCLVEITIDTRTVRGVIRTSAVATSAALSVLLAPVLAHIRVAQ